MPAQVALVTGASGAIGAAIAAGLASRGFKVVLLGRKSEKLERCRARLRRDLPDADLVALECDVSRRAHIERVAQAFVDPLHVLVNNAAVAPKQRLQTPESIELQWATNVLGYYWMIQAFSQHLAASGKARVVNVASYWAGGLALDDVEWKRRRYDNDAAYRQSKQADRMLTCALAPVLRERGIAINSCHPGDVNSRLSNDLGFGGHESPQAGARTPLWLATSGELAYASGGYYAQCRREHCRFCDDSAEVERLLQVCASY